MNKLKKSTKEQYLTTKIRYPMMKKQFLYNYLEKLKRQVLKLLDLRVCAYTIVDRVLAPPNLLYHHVYILGCNATQKKYENYIKLQK